MGFDQLAPLVQAVYTRKPLSDHFKSSVLILCNEEAVSNRPRSTSSSFCAPYFDTHQAIAREPGSIYHSTLADFIELYGIGVEKVTQWYLHLPLAILESLWDPKEFLRN